MKIYFTTDKEFLQYGKRLNLDTTEILSAAETIALPQEGSLYEASTALFEALPIMKTVTEECFGGIPTQLGYCWGHSNRLNALEWHKSSEINIAVTDLILLLGDVREIEEGNQYSSDKVRAFLVKKGEAIEVFATTMHFCPIETTKQGFGCVVGLPKGTNTDLDFMPENKLIFRKNKWIMAHNDNQALLDRGVLGGIYGENYDFSEVTL